ncbi:putative baseplate assembly protein V [Roseibium sp. TrichSKD4]|uniref:phage baseplate assembly protein V n=1 Tax=Roseibium sp. TrichSKD4 TaxID=744980 RepID=UPI0001E57600|nr:phage baseplate assembly protein V [Roseibium sp. TrichSKD4]EFO30935.1 putative baseplate assembly protein V [Roseibium sp. TrichSKD4]
MPLDHLLRKMNARIVELERVTANVVRRVRVKENRNGKLIVEDDTGFVSGEVPQASMSAGGWKVDAPAGAGAQGILLCAGGDPAQGTFFPGLPSDADPAASTDTGILKLISPEGKTLTIDGNGFAFVGDVTIDGAFDVTGASFTHNAKNVGHDHKHKDVVPGPSPTGVPL